ncbi:transporter [Sinorhizobium sp. RAC02]|uniref:transporter n=1 Tax=Sinorhizobium sp. RAC02 TaxID=1842534 RepID=UPI00085730FC|nr:transporter [Sinorhizobium sp. RAC02]AOF94474.1 putative intracellular protease/amidase [Sinorhizobium sp. RAC02]
MTEMPAVPRFLILIVEDAEEMEVGLSWIAPAYYAFKDVGAEIAIATPLGGPPILAGARGEGGDAVERFRADRQARDELADTLSVDQIVIEDFNGAFCFGMAGGIWSDGEYGLAPLVRAFLAAGKPVALVPGRHVLVTPEGAGNGLLILGESAQSPLRAAQALIRVVQQCG